MAGFPWGDNHPTRRQRLAVAVTLGVIAALAHYFRAAESDGVSDFTSLWYGAQFLLEGRNPYELIGPGRLIGMPSPAYYPAPAFLVAIPFTILSYHWASTAFVFVSSALLAWGCTRGSWHRLPLFPSIAFLTSAQLGQWSILFTAALFIPAIALVSIAKPQAALPVVVGREDPTPFYYAAAGGALLLAASLVMLPGWIGDWFELVRNSDHFTPPIARTGGPLVALVLLKWKRPEAWLVLLAACTPQTWYPYNGLVLLAIAPTYRSACVLSLASSTGWIISALLVDGHPRDPDVRAVMGAALVAGSYLPATILILTQRNEGQVPFWLRWLQRGKCVYIAASGR